MSKCMVSIQQDQHGIYIDSGGFVLRPASGMVTGFHAGQQVELAVMATLKNQCRIRSYQGSQHTAANVDCQELWIQISQKEIDLLEREFPGEMAEAIYALYQTGITSPVWLATPERQKWNQRLTRIQNRESLLHSGTSERFLMKTLSTAIGIPLEDKCPICGRKIDYVLYQSPQPGALVHFVHLDGTDQHSMNQRDFLQLLNKREIDGLKRLTWGLIR